MVCFTKQITLKGEYALIIVAAALFVGTMLGMSMYSGEIDQFNKYAVCFSKSSHFENYSDTDIFRYIRCYDIRPNGLNFTMTPIDYSQNVSVVKITSYNGS
jgi:hypothetical protein